LLVKILPVALNEYQEPNKTKAGLAAGFFICFLFLLLPAFVMLFLGFA
jgi:hypothetical protein